MSQEVVLANHRWKQRLSNFENALKPFGNAVKLATGRDITRLEELGLIRYFGISVDLAWEVLKDYLEHQGVIGISGPRDTVRAACKSALIEDGEGWMDMITDRSRSSHTYSEETAQEIAKRIVERYYPAFLKLAEILKKLATQPGFFS
jgi:nucleotidyltransferase substrate binding protein (TIGR01987 family)